MQLKVDLLYMVVLYPILKHVKRYKSHSDHKYGFVQARSTGDLSCIPHLWSTTLNDYKESFVMALNISKVSDRVWHVVLLAKLQSSGLASFHSDLISSFLSDTCYCRWGSTRLCSLPYSLLLFIKLIGHKQRKVTIVTLKNEKIEVKVWQYTFAHNFKINHTIFGGEVPSEKKFIWLSPNQVTWIYLQWCVPTNA